MLNIPWWLSLRKKYIDNLSVNIIWGLISNLLQNVLFSAFFIVIARKYNSQDFASYILSNTLYGMLLAFSSLGLGQWFIRTYMTIEDQLNLVYTFLKMQVLVGFIFYGFNIVLAYFLYKDPLIRNLSFIIGINIVFDNIIYVVKYVNIARYEQKKTFLILTIEAFIKCMIACLLFISPIPILYLSFILIVLRLLSLHLFLQYGTNVPIKILRIFDTPVSLKVIRAIIEENFFFIIIGSISVIYWKLGNLFISKFLTLKEVAIYEISFKFFSIAEVLPTIASTTVFPLLVTLYADKNRKDHSYFHRSFWYYAGFGLFAYTFIYCYSDFILPFLFTDKYTIAVKYCNQMFLTILIFPTALLQANLLIALQLEKIDMWLNVTSLLFNVLFSVIALYFFKDLSYVNYAVFFSFLLFHAAQDYFLIKKNIYDFKHCLKFYAVSVATVLFFHLTSLFVNKYVLFVFFWALLLGLLIYLSLFKRRRVLSALPVTS